MSRRVAVAVGAVVALTAGALAALKRAVELRQGEQELCRSVTPLSRYEPRTVAGFSTLWHPDCAGGAASVCAEAEAAAGEDLESVLRRVPCEASRVLVTVPVVFSIGLPKIGTTSGRVPRYWQPENKWLPRCGLNDRIGVVEIADSAAYVQHRPEDPAVVLHELAHAYLELSGEREAVRTAYDRAKASGRYEGVWKRNWSFERGTATGYAMTSVDEYFAELSEAYFWVNDWYPFLRFQIRDFDPAGATVVRQVWAGGGDESACVRR